MCPAKTKAKAKAADAGPVPLTPSEVKAKARAFFYKLLNEGKSPWPNKFLAQQGFTRRQCPSCKKYYWSCDPARTNCGDSTCAGGYSFLHPDDPPAQRVTYYQSWVDFQQSFTTTRVPHAVVPRYPVVARWRSDVDFVAAGIYCFQPFCVSGESDPPGNPLIQAEFCLRFNDLDNIGITGRHYSGFHMIGIQVFNHAQLNKDPQPPFDEIEEVYWKDGCIENCYRWATETLHQPKEALTFIEDVWQGGGNCGACVEFFSGGLEIGNMVFTEYAVSYDGQFSPIETKVIDVGIGMERIPWLVNGGWTSYLDVFDYMLPELSAKLNVPIDTPYFRKFASNTALFDVDENENVAGTWERIGRELDLLGASETDPTKSKLAVFRDELRLFADLVVVCDHTRTVLFAIEDGALPSNVGGCNNIRNVLRRVFAILKRRDWIAVLGGVPGIVDLFRMHERGLAGFIPEFRNMRCLERVIELEFERWTTGKVQALRSLKGLIDKQKGAPLDIPGWILAMESFGVDPAEIAEFTGRPAPDDLWLRIDEQRFRTARQLEAAAFDVTGIPVTRELFNLPDFERVYEHSATVIAVVTPHAFVCDETVLYPTSGGQEHDVGSITIGGDTYAIQTIEKVCNVVVFVVDQTVDSSIVGQTAIQKVDKFNRETLRVQHTATHIIAAAARRVLGPHVWQNGAKKTAKGAHIDLTHYELPSYDVLMEIDRVANELILSAARVVKRVYTRKEAEGRWGFVLYQGGAIPGNDIRVVDIQGIDTEACCGTHCDALTEIGSVKIIAGNKVQDGVFRIEFVAGHLAVASHQQDMRLLKTLTGIFNCEQGDLEKNCTRFFSERNGYLATSKKLANELFEAQIALAFSRGYPAFVIKRAEEDITMFVKGLPAAIAGKTEANGKSIVVVGVKFFFGLVQPPIAAVLTQALAALATEKQFKVLQGKAPLSSGHIEFKAVSFPPESRRAILDVFAANQFVV
jgi:alanyl-tRNA synthetase